MRRRSCQIRNEATPPARSKPEIAASKRATPSGIVPVSVKYETFTDRVFWRMKIRSRTSTNAPAIIPIHARETRVGVF
jgi:hypothetical protein